MAETSPEAPAPNRFLQGLWRGLQGKCPNCGNGRLYTAYLKVRSVCEACGHDNAQYRTDDAAPYFTILLIGHLAIGTLLFFPFVHTAPLWLVLGTTIPGIAILTLALLPVVKGAVLGALWAVSSGRESGRELGHETDATHEAALEPRLDEV